MASPNESNAHPHATDSVAVVHNGIIENFRELRDEAAAGRRYISHRDRHRGRRASGQPRDRCNGQSPVDAVGATLPRLRGAFALAFLFAGDEDLLIGARKGSPLAVGYGDGEMYLGSDAHGAGALHRHACAYLEDGDWAVLTAQGRRRSATRPLTAGRAPRDARPRRLGASWWTRATTATSWPRRSTSSRKWSATRWRIILDMASERVRLPVKLPFDFGKMFTALSISACGTAFYAGLVAKYWFERFAAPAGRDR